MDCIVHGVTKSQTQLSNFHFTWWDLVAQWLRPHTPNAGSLGLIPGQRIWSYFAAAAKSLQSCLTLCDPMDGSPPGSPVLGILQERTLEWVSLLQLRVHMPQPKIPCAVTKSWLSQINKYFLEVGAWKIVTFWGMNRTHHVLERSMVKAWVINC